MVTPSDTNTNVRTATSTALFLRTDFVPRPFSFVFGNEVGKLEPFGVYQFQSTFPSDILLTSDFRFCFQIIGEENDSPPVTFNITVSHENGSVYDARNVTVADAAEGMDYYNPSGPEDDGAFVTYPKKNAFMVEFTLPSLLSKRTFPYDCSLSRLRDQK